MRTSLWQATASTHQPYPALEGDAETDVTIIGGGITGLTCAVLLATAGKRVIVLEARKVGEGTTGHSTGNLYEILSSGLSAVQSKWDKHVAGDVAASRRAAVDLVEQFCGRIGTDTCFRRCPLHLYSEDDWSEIDREYDTMRAVGVAVRRETAATLVGRSGGAVILDGQAQFHPLNYAQGLARLATDLGCRVHEHSEVQDIDGARRVARTARGSVKSAEVILATHTPKGIFTVHAEMVTWREYGVAIEVDAIRNADRIPPGIFWQRGRMHRSYRNLDIGGNRYLIAVGESAKTGLHDPARVLLSLMESGLLDKSPADTPTWSWSAQGYRSPDILPYIGRSPKGDVFIATGFGTDGLTYGSLAARIISDEILGRDNQWARLYRAARFTPMKSARQFVEEQAVALKGLVRDRVSVRKYEPGDSSLAAGAGEVVKHGGDLVAVCRDETGAAQSVSAVCTHMGCIVHWNAVEKSWDCPCHGSRFDTDGAVLEGPALSPLKRIELRNQAAA